MKEIEYKFILDIKSKNKLEKYLKKEKAQLVKNETQDNWYYKAQKQLDLRIRRTDNKAFLILKNGWMHNVNRDEIEVKTARANFNNLDKILTSLGYKYDTKWYRKRSQYKLGNLNITIDFNAGYGWVTEIERITKKGGEKKAEEEILKFAKKIGIKPASQKLFDKMYKFYKKNWRHYYKTKTTFDINKI